MPKKGEKVRPEVLAKRVATNRALGYPGNKKPKAPRSEVSREKQRQKMLGREMNAEWRKGLVASAARWPDKTCPHCSKVGRGPAMYRYHFEACKWNPAYKSDEAFNSMSLPGEARYSGRERLIR